MALAEDLQTPKNSLLEFIEITQRILGHLREVIDSEEIYNDYSICTSVRGNTKIDIRPFNQHLFIREKQQFIDTIDIFKKIIQKLIKREFNFQNTDYQVVDKVIYTIQQSIGIGLDLFLQPNSARKLVGTRFEELIRALIHEINVQCKKIILNIPYDTDEGVKYYKCETDVVISPFEKVESNSKNIHKNEIVLSLKTTTKDRMPKIFIDKILMEKFLNHKIKIVGISQNDIQRKNDRNKKKISSTFVSNLFMVYSKFLTELDGYYYLDMPNRAYDSPFNKYIHPFSELILKDIWKLLSS